MTKGMRREKDEVTWLDRFYDGIDTIRVGEDWIRSTVDALDRVGMKELSRELHEALELIGRGRRETREAVGENIHAEFLESQKNLGEALTLILEKVFPEGAGEKKT